MLNQSRGRLDDLEGIDNTYAIIMACRDRQTNIIKSIGYYFPSVSVSVRNQSPSDRRVVIKYENLLMLLKCSKVNKKIHPARFIQSSQGC